MLFEKKPNFTAVKQLLNFIVMEWRNGFIYRAAFWKGVLAVIALCCIILVAGVIMEYDERPLSQQAEFAEYVGFDYDSEDVPLQTAEDSAAVERIVLVKSKADTCPAYTFADEQNDLAKNSQRISKLVNDDSRAARIDSLINERIRKSARQQNYRSVKLPPSPPPLPRNNFNNIKRYDAFENVFKGALSIFIRRWL